MTIFKGDLESTHFLNVDLDIYSKYDLQPLVTALGKKIIVLFVGRVKRTYQAHLEVTRLTGDADSTIRAFCSLIRSLPHPERQLWDSAKQREFNVGIQAGPNPYSTEFELENQTVKSAAELNARIVFTIYAPEKPGLVIP
jgi:hypothetical protein